MIKRLLRFQKPFTPPFAIVRSKLDYSYHEIYSLERQAFQDQIIKGFLPEETYFSRRPRLIYTAGAMGAGKSHSLKIVAPILGVNLDLFVWIDPDRVREHLPEYHQLKKTDPENAGAKTRKESGMICEIIMEVALQRSLNIVSDGSLSQWEWFRDEFNRIRIIYPQYRWIEIMYVTASWDKVLKRAQNRGEETGRQIDPKTLHQVYLHVPKSIESLKPHTDLIYYIDNEEDHQERLSIDQIWRRRV